MRPELTEVTLDTLGGGVVPELFAHEMANILANIDDPNTAPTAVRRLTIEVSIKPGESRENAAILVAVKSKLAGVRPSEIVVHLTKERGRLVALTTDPRQPDLPFGAESNIVPIEGGTNAGR